MYLRLTSKMRIEQRQVCSITRIIFHNFCIKSLPRLSARYQIKKMRNYPIPYVHLNEQWFKDIVDCQREIRCLSHADYYGKPRHERSWWLHIPKGIREDWLSRPVENCNDIGCGYSTLALYCRRLLNCSVYCIDFREILSPLLAKKYGIKFSLCNAEIEPIPWNLNFDIIVFTEILEHLNFHPTPTQRL
jgi:2-polyprenyl-3-methyl-5-hydroxy-6-metoxy-1,4-benzoquinol methylase